MSRLTITLSDKVHRGLKETAARTGKTMGRIIEESLVRAGVKDSESAEELLARIARGLEYTLSEEEVVEEVRAHRREKQARGRRR